MPFREFGFDLIGLKLFYKRDLLGPSHLILKLGSLSLNIPKALIMWNRAKCTEYKDFACSYDLHPWLSNIIQGHSRHTLWSNAPCWWSMIRIRPREEKVSSGQRIFFNSALVLNLDLETWFNIIAHPLTSIAIRL